MLATQQIFLIAALLCFLVFLALLSAASERVQGVQALLAAALLGLVGNLLYAFGLELPPILSYEAANVAYTGAGAALAIGYRQLAGLPERLGPFVMGVGVVGVLIVVFHDYHDSFTGRSAAISLFQAGICVDIGRSVLAGRPHGARRFVLLMCVLVALGHMGRMAWLLTAPETPVSLLQPSVMSVAILTAASLSLPALVLGGLLTLHRSILHQAEYIANHDHLTGAWSRKAFFDIAERELARGKRSNQALSLMLIDLDHFKAINDNNGHEAGDVALQLVAERVRRNLRAVDCFARLGGDEFAVLLPDTNLQQACLVGDKLQEAVHVASSQAAAHGQPALTLSIGVTVTDEGETFKAALARADAALYAAKSAGRNRVHALAPGEVATRRRHIG